jgi:hypothetical protein
MAARKSGNAAPKAAAPSAETEQKEAGQTASAVPAQMNQGDDQTLVLPDEITVKTRRGLTTFRRAGLRFGKEPVVLKTADLSDEQIAAILGERNLVVAEA